MQRTSMRQVLAGFLRAVLPACARTDLANQCAAALVAVARNSYRMEVGAAGARVTLAGKDLDLSARIEQEGQQQSKWVVGIAVRTSVPGDPSHIAGSVGVGDTRADALDTAVAEWAQLAGVAILNGVVLRERSTERLVHDGYVFYPGTTGVRGPEQPAWSNEDRLRLLALITPELPKLTESQLHDVSLSLAVNPAGDVQGECRLDGASSQAILDAVKTFSCPKLKTPYIFKQYYVFERQR